MRTLHEEEVAGDKVSICLSNKEIMTQFGFLTIPLILCSLSQTASEVSYIYIASDSNVSCTGQSCQMITLSQFAANLSHYIRSNTTLVFSPGTHYLQRVNLTLSNLESFVMKSENSKAQVQCISSSRMSFIQSQYIHIANLEFFRCRGNQVKHIQDFVVHNTKFDGQNAIGTALELIETTAQIINSTFVSNSKGVIKKCDEIELPWTLNCSGVEDIPVGGAIVSTRSTINISCCKFEDNEAFIGGAILAEQNSIINMSESIFTNNNAIMGSGLCSFSSTIVIKASEFHNNTCRDSEIQVLYSSGAVLYSLGSNIIIETSDFVRNNAKYGGGALSCYDSSITIKTSKFHNNSAFLGGALDTYNCTLTIKSADFQNNGAIRKGGVLDFYFSTITIEACDFHNNIASFGGVLYSNSSTIALKASNFRENVAYVTSDFVRSIGSPRGGVLSSYNSTTTIETSKFHNNSAYRGGALDTYNCTLTMESATFQNNNATDTGGVLDSYDSKIIIEACEFHKNIASRGGALYSYSSTIEIKPSNYSNNVASVTSNFVSNNAIHGGGALWCYDSSVKIVASKFHHNSASIGGVLASSSSTITVSSEFSANPSSRVIVSNNLGSLIAFGSNITFSGYTRFENNTPGMDDTQDGGALTLFQSNAIFNGICNLVHNHATNGGAIHSTESKIHVNGNVTITCNTATRNGGGVYLLNSELNCKPRSNLGLLNNHARHKGGGLHAISSSITAASSWKVIYTGTSVTFKSNTAEKGGGLSLEANANVNILKYDVILNFSDDQNVWGLDNTLSFTANKADYGGAVFVDDNTNSGACSNDSRTRCFFQVFGIHGYFLSELKTESIHFLLNNANVSGSTLYGGLLDRCAVSRFAEVHYKEDLDIKVYRDGNAYFKTVSTINQNQQELSVATNISISSLPLRVCLCVNNTHDVSKCNNNKHIEVKKGQEFTLSVVAIDQTGQPVSAVVQASLSFAKRARSGLDEGQQTRDIRAECTNLTFNVVSSQDSENLILYALDGPCKDAELSKTTIEILFIPCSCLVGLQVSGTNSTSCTCECNSNIKQHMEQCNTNGSLIKQPQSRAWISYINDTGQTGYLVYDNCPYDYCSFPSPPFSLNQPNGADAQCALNRSSLLCGSCQSGLSLSLGSSRCLHCPRYSPALFIVITTAAILAGIALVALLLVLNMTVATGSINGLIFYTNVVYANRSILLPFQETSFVAVLISWMNLDLGIDTCFFPQMDTYAKTWLQIVFPAYVILLVVFVIIISSYSTKFTNLIGKKDPVATLATLVLLAYAKLIEICFKSLSVATLEYPDESPKMLWLPDGTVKYASGKHVALMLTAVLILLIGLLYTALLFSWQWLLYLPRWKIFSWSRNPKIQTFIETYHKPYIPKCRYWSGLLLVVRIVLYLVAAVNDSNDPTLSLTSIGSVVSLILATKLFAGGRLYMDSVVDVLETFFYLNISLFVFFTWYSLDDPDRNKEAAAYTSVSITIFVLLLIILYHAYTYTSLFARIRIKETKLGVIIDKRSANIDPQPIATSDNRQTHELLDFIDRPVNSSDYTVKPTKSVVEIQCMHHPKLAPLDTQHTPSAAEATVRLEVINDAASQV